MVKPPESAEILFRNGSLYVASQNSYEVLRYDAQTGAFLDKDSDPANLGLVAVVHGEPPHSEVFILGSEAKSNNILFSRS